MRFLVSRIQEKVRRVSSVLSAPQLAPRDETLMFSNEQVRFLAERGVIYLTERPDGQYSTIIAHDYQVAARIAGYRNAAERVVGLMGPDFLHYVRTPASQAQDDSHAIAACADGWRYFV